MFGFVSGFVSVLVSGIVFRFLFVKILFERTSVNQRGPSEPPEVFVCVCVCFYKCVFLAHAFVNQNIKNEKLNCFFSWSFSKNVCAFFKVIHCPGVLGVGFPTQSTRRPVGRRGPHTMLPGRRPAPPPQRPSHTTHYNIILYNTNGE